MCGRYVMARAVGDLVAAAEAEADDALELRRSWNIAPTTDVPIVLERLVDGAPVRQLHVAAWGLVPGWAKDPAVGVRSFNARSETVLEKPTFRSSVKSRRCAVPMEGYYEWRKSGTGKAATKQPYFVHRADGDLGFFAGLYSWWKDPSKDDGAADRWLLSCSIMTMESPAAGAEPGVLAGLHGLHDRMPVPLSRQGMDAWLDPEDPDAAGLVEQVRAEAYGVASGWDMRPVESTVGNVRNDGPELTEPAYGTAPEPADAAGLTDGAGPAGPAVAASPAGSAYAGASRSGAERPADEGDTLF